MTLFLEMPYLIMSFRLRSGHHDSVRHQEIGRNIAAEGGTLIAYGQFRAPEELNPSANGNLYDGF